MEEVKRDMPSDAAAAAAANEEEEEGNAIQNESVDQSAGKELPEDMQTSHEDAGSGESDHGAKPGIPRTAFTIFSEQAATDEADRGTTLSSLQLRFKWGALTQQERQMYETLAAKDRERAEDQRKAARSGQHPKDTAGGDENVDGVGDHDADDDDDVIANDDQPQAQLQAQGAKSSRPQATVEYPVARVKRICKLDPDVRGLSKEALFLVSKCAELFTVQLGSEAVKVARMQNRRTIASDDLATVCATREPYQFLKDDVRDLIREQRERAQAQAQSKRKASEMDAANAGADVKNTIKSYFGSKKK
uniref:HMG box domain-containing protein n=1 Tax=Craspedostauros australis TaxID=1486917 RepID=A0A7R9ZLX8_9STRA|mmetsp:Transcript_18510/g.51468  ORF Transcript_18510/g.51468 Transcript_18510/m.51468 type:complete len:305 (+) Transcript_18510:271-1185(+)|eukprot:CAMPEP_0198110982 /NCGR_PEP_ID=MMETSP1442-20131203/2961_1 /TAXON_ID= /ORGANISM="Craspedostauros australis, Strain CCMP3328" /LENGTH=304 /DNA_ID=CAMNT_0043767235 /DNA_START=210 /DNA_END=1124 /DNA_ORIENTATION=-